MADDILLLSGGVDSTALAYSLQPDHAVTIDYGQIPAKAETRASEQICRVLNIKHAIIRIDCSDLGSGSMAEQEQSDSGSTPEWWPFRNQLLITVSAMYAVKQGASTLILGTVKSDRKHADGRPEFVERMNEIVGHQEGNIKIAAPAISKTSIELVRETGAPKELIGWTHSCFRSNYACGECRGCAKRSKIFEEAFISGR